VSVSASRRATGLPRRRTTRRRQPSELAASSTRSADGSANVAALIDGHLALDGRQRQRELGRHVELARYRDHGAALGAAHRDGEERVA
jgi:hypothetical protein